MGTAESGVFTSTDGGATWTPRNDGLTTYRVNCLVAHPGDPDAVYCGTDAGLLENKGARRWTSVGGLAGMDVQALVILPGTGRMLAGAAWVGSGTNLFSSEDGGAHWEPADRGLPRASVFCLAYDAFGDRVLAGTSVGVFQLASDKSRWVRLGRNLDAVRVFSMATAEGIGYAATAHGLFGIAPGSNRWVDLGLGPTRSAVTDVVVRSVSRPVPES